ncbi:MAG: prepilin-type N-terminal cleavage/methylation domain-containing protein [Planctomycetes bacterium]|nr:prepilin-type N-terminal cleavage/methylation domain-containing protein [Planctomycetota bacterium]
MRFVRMGRGAAFKARGVRGGFTLMELLVAVGLMVILITAVVVVFIKSTQVFRTAESLMEIFQNARAAVGTVSREVAGAFPLDSNNQEFIIYNPRNGDAIDWTRTVAGVDYTRPFLVVITQTAWVDNSDPGNPQRVVGAAKVIYRLRKDPTGIQRFKSRTITMERALLKAEKRFNPGPATTAAELDQIDPELAAQQIDGRSGGTLKITVDECRYIRYQEDNGNRGSLHFEFFYVDPADGNASNRFFAEPGKNWPHYPVAVTPPNPIHFHLNHANVIYRKLPMGIRVKMQVVDDKENQVRTVAREIWIPAARSE